MNILKMVLVLALVTLGCSTSSEEDSSSRNVGGTDAGANQNMGSSNRGQSDSSSRQTCADGVPLAAVSDWSNILPKPATSVEAVWTGEHFGVIWLASEASNGLRPLQFVRVSPEGDTLGDTITIGQAAAASHRIVFTGERYVVAWVNGRSADDNYDGIRVGVVSAEGAMAETTYDVADTYNTVQLDLSWDSFAGGLLVYTKGTLGEGGIHVTTINADASLNAEQTVDERATSAFSAVYGDGAWAVAYALRDEELNDPILLHLLDDEGRIYDPAPISLGNQALGRVHIAFSRGNYAIAWTGMNAEDKVQPATVLLDGAAEVIGEPVISLPADFGIVEDMVGVSSQGFILSWHGEIEGEPILGVQVMSALGILEDPMLLGRGLTGNLSQSRLVLGMEEQIHVFSTLDAAPQPLGYSADVEVSRILLESCD